MPSGLRKQVPLTFFAPPHASSELGRVSPQARRLGSELVTWQDSPFHRNRSSSLGDHRGTKLGTRAQRWAGGKVVEPITHAPATRLRATAISADPLVAANARTVSPRHAGQCLKLKAPRAKKKINIRKSPHSEKQPPNPQPDSENARKTLITSVSATTSLVLRFQIPSGRTMFLGFLSLGRLQTYREEPKP